MKFEREIFTSKDGSKTIYWPKFDEHYHSVNGAATESIHVFIEAGLKEVTQQKNNISIFEMGFGTGLNALLTCIEAKESQTTIDYTSVEAFPVEQELQNQLEFHSQIKDAALTTKKLFDAPWNEKTDINEFFSITKVNSTLQAFQPIQKFDLIYYDAFAPSAQPELWTKEIFEKLYAMLNKNGILTTYCAKGQVKRDLKSAGFEIEALPGPPGKREITRARKR